MFKLRKHDKNKSATHTIEDEAVLKLPYLMDMISDENVKEKLRKNPLIVEEFIQITGREVKS